MQVSQQVLEWQVEAERRTARAYVLRACERRFDIPAPPDIATAIAAVEDLNELIRVFDLTFAAHSLDAFRAAIKPVVVSKNGN